jgi:hypothetical protein
VADLGPSATADTPAPTGGKSSWLGPLSDLTLSDWAQLLGPALASIPIHTGHGVKSRTWYPLMPLAAAGPVLQGVESRKARQAMGGQVRKAAPGPIGELAAAGMESGTQVPGAVYDAITSQAWAKTKQAMLGTLEKDFPQRQTLEAFAADPNVDPKLLENRIDWLKAFTAKDDQAQQRLDMQGKALALRAQQGQAAGGAGALDEATAKGLGEAYLAGDRSVMQGLGYGKLGASNRAKVLNYAYGQGGLPGGEMAARGAEYRGTRQAYQNVRTWVARAEISQKGFLKNLQVALSLMKRVDPGQIPMVNKLVAQGKAVTGDPAIVAYAQALQTAAREYERLITGPNSNAQLLAGAQDQAARLLTTAQTPEQVQAVANVMQQDIQNTIGAARDELDTLSTDLRGTSPMTAAAPAGGGAAGARQSAPAAGGGDVVDWGDLK